MTILTRYMLRSHLGPFIFALSAVTGLLFLNAVAQRLETLAGKGLGLGIIGEFLLLSLPHIVALTFPMAILVAVLYAFAELSGQNELAAMAAGGVHPGRLLIPLAGVGVILSLMMFGFNDRILPESNHRLSNLLGDIGSKSPTFELREEVVNEVFTGDDSRYFLRASTIDPVANHLTDVTIFDLGRPGQNRTIVADSGTMAFTPDGADLILTLWDGTVYETADDRPGSFQRLEFTTQFLPLRGVGAEMERRVGAGGRSDREMNIAMLQARVDENLEHLRAVARESREISMETLERALGYGVVAGGTDELQIPDGPGILTDGLVENVAGIHRINDNRWGVYRLASYRYRVEIHKKYAIAFACFIFVLLGPPLAIRFPQGGVGMVIAASVGIFFFYWMGLIAGERFADRGQIDPILGMWAPNLILLIPTLLLLKGVGKKVSTGRTAGFGDLYFRVRRLFRLPLPGGGSPAPAGGSDR